MNKTKGLLEPDVAQAMWTWAWTELDAVHQCEGRPNVDEIEALLDVLTYLACELSLAGNHEWVAGLPRLLELHHGWALWEVSPRDKCLEAVSELLRRGAPISKAVEAMARARDRSVRAAVANGLPIDNPEARALLEQLRVDPDPHIRKLVSQRLPKDEPSAWWVGKFKSDPIPRLGAEASDEVIAALRTAALFVDREREQQRAMIGELGPALARLPTPILSELVGRFVTFNRIAPGYAQMIGELLRRPNGTNELWALLAPRVRNRFDYVPTELILKDISKDWEPELIERLCRELLQGLLDRRHDPRVEGMAALVDALLRDFWPPSLPGGLLLDAWQTLAADAPALAEEFLLLLHHEGVDLSGEIGRLLPLAEQDKSLVRALGCAVKRLDPESRAAFIERGMASASDKVRALALEQLATLPPDPKHGSITRFWSEPALRQAITNNRRLCEAFLPFLRRQLRAQTLDFSEATATLAAVARLWDGAVGPDVHVDIDRAARLEELAAWHDGASELGPPTEDEWANWRALRQEKLDTEQATPIYVLALRPPGPLQAMDRAVVDELMTRWRQRWREPERPDWLKFELLHFHHALLGFGGAELLEQLEELLAAAREIEDAILVAQMEPGLEELRLASK